MARFQLWKSGAALLAAFLLMSAPVLAQDRIIERAEDADYFGFDLRTERNLTLPQCESACLADPACRAFTYNRRAQWCFLKSDFSRLDSSPGAVAGKVVEGGADPDLGAPPTLAFLPADVVDAARQYRQAQTSADGDPSVGLGALVNTAVEQESAGDPRLAAATLAQALALAPEDPQIWLGVAQSTLAVAPLDTGDAQALAETATSAALNAYLVSRTATVRAQALAALGASLDRRDIDRPAINTLEASLALQSSAEVEASLGDLKRRKGFRVLDHSVDAEAATPRICAQVSEDLVKSGVDYASFVTVDGRPPQAVEARDRQICVEGLEHGRSYRVSLRAGLPSAIGEVIQSPVSLDIYVRDRQPAARFGGDAFVLPSGGRHGIPLTTVNMAEAELSLYRIGDRALAQLLAGQQFLRQLDGYDIGTVADDLGTPLWRGRIAIQDELNRDVTTSFPVNEALPERKPGVYVLTAQPVDDTSQSWQSRATQWFVVSDLGLSTFAGEDGLSVFARSLDTARPLAGVELTLLARNNEELGRATTDGQGRATFTPGLMRGTAGLTPAVLTASAPTGDDFVFLDMTRAGFDLSDRGVTGRAAPGALDIFAWTERGIYRAGETVHAAALARDEGADAVEALPLTFIFSRPDGVEDRRIVSTSTALGFHGVPFATQPNAMRGTWTMRIHTDPEQPAVASQTFLVEDFVPDRIEFDLASDQDAIGVGEIAQVSIDGRFLYGAPAAGLAPEGEVNIRTRRDWAPFPRFLFGLDDEEEEEGGAVLPLADLPLLDEQGQASFDVAVDAPPSTTRLIEAEVVVRLREGGGRAVERRINIPVKPESDMIGLRLEGDGTSVPEGSTARIAVIASDADGNRIDARGLAWQLSRIERDYQWFRTNNSWNYEPVNRTVKVAEGRIDARADAEAFMTAPVEWGRYRLEVTSAEAGGAATSIAFDAGWYVEAASTETPDALEIAFDKPSYRIGDTAKIKITPRFGGEALLAIGSDRLLDIVTASVPEAGTEITLPVTEAFGAGTYVTATLFRPGSAATSRMPMRAVGIKWLPVDPAARKLDIALDLPERAEPRSALEVPVSVPSAAGQQAFVTLAAVDVGILNLTRYEAPDPAAWYYGQRRLGLEIRDLYGRMIDGSLGATGRIRTGGDGGSMALQGSPPTERLVAFFEGPVELDGQGRASVSFDIPQFNGTVRVMAVAWTKDAVGHAQGEVVVRDPVVITAGLPRFLAPGDAAELRLDLANTDGPAGEWTLDVSGSDEVAVDQVGGTIELDAGGRETVVVPITGQRVGQGRITVHLTHADSLSVEQILDLPVRPANAPLTTRNVVALAPGASLTVDRELLAASLLDGASVSVGVTRFAALDVASLVMTLDRYPYGCAEQITSRALPLLYLSDLAASAGVKDDAALRGRVQDAIARVLSHQSSSGSFGLWGPGYGDLWLDAYVTDFLTRAREQGYEVPAQAMMLALQNLRNATAYDADLQAKNREIAYTLYVLARNKKASVGDLRYYADTQIDNFTTPMARAQIAAALSLYGDVERAEVAFASAFRLASNGAGASLDRTDYGSDLRDRAAMLALAAETSPAPSALIPQMVQLVSSERDARRATSTQEEAWMALAARGLAAGGIPIRLDLEGVAHDGAFSRRLSGEAIEASPITLTNRGSETVQAVVTAVAPPIDPLPAGGEGFAIERTYYTPDGEPANITDVTQNERFVVVLSLREDNAWPSRVLVSDLLPAGFEIDNPSLVGSAELSNFAWLEKAEPAHLEFRSDRFVAAFDRTADSPREVAVAYVVRAVTPGIYAHPAASVEDMYRPQFSARTASGMMEVRAP